MRRLSNEQSLLVSIELLALGWKYILQNGRGQRMSFLEVVRFLDDLRSAMQNKKELSDEALVRKYRIYLRRLESLEYPIRVDFREGNVDMASDPNALLQLFRIYLKAFVSDYSEQAMRLYFDNVRVPLEALYHLVLFRYCMEHCIVIEFSYKKLYLLTKRSLRAIPVAFSCRKDHLNLIASDVTAQNIKKQFIASRITAVHTDFYNGFYKSLAKRDQTTNRYSHDFDIHEYYKTKEGNFGWQLDSYQLEFSGRALDHFRQRHSNEVEKLKITRKDDGYLVCFESYDRLFVMQLLFLYGSNVRLLKPASLGKNFKQRLKEIQQHYSA